MIGRLKKIVKSLGFIFPIWLLVYFWPRSVTSMAFFKKKHRTYNIAHRGGGALGPEETLVAFKNSVQAGANMFEYDVHMTKDGYLIASHDETVDRITSGKGLINELTLAEIKGFDAGVKFVDLNGDRPYIGNHVPLATVEEIFQAFPDIKAVIELKDTNDPGLYEAIVQEMWRLIQQYQMEDKVIIASFDHKINHRFREVSKRRVAIGGGQQAATSYIVKMILRLNGLARTDAQAFQLPIEQFGIDLTQKNIIQGSKRLGIDVYYWTINDPETMRDLISKGANGIMTDNPALLQEVLDEKFG